VASNKNRDGGCTIKNRKIICNFIVKAVVIKHKVV